MLLPPKAQLRLEQESKLENKSNLDLFSKLDSFSNFGPFWPLGASKTFDGPRRASKIEAADGSFDLKFDSGAPELVGKQEISSNFQKMLKNAPGRRPGDAKVTPR